MGFNDLVEVTEAVSVEGAILFGGKVNKLAFCYVISFVAYMWIKTPSGPSACSRDDLSLLMAFLKSTVASSRHHLEI